MHHALTTLIAVLALNGPAFAQAPTAPVKPPAPARPACPPGPWPTPSRRRRSRTHRGRRARAGGAGRPDGAARRARAADPQESAGGIADHAGQTTRAVRAEPDQQRRGAAAPRPGEPLARPRAARGSHPQHRHQRRSATRSTPCRRSTARRNADVKHEVLQAWLISGRKEAVYQAALNAKIRRRGQRRDSHARRHGRGR